MEKQILIVGRKIAPTFTDERILAICKGCEYETNGVCNIETEFGSRVCPLVTIYVYEEEV